jgi:hypothetical protein
MAEVKIEGVARDSSAEDDNAAALVLLYVHHNEANKNKGTLATRTVDALGAVHIRLTPAKLELKHLLAVGARLGCDVTAQEAVDSMAAAVALQQQKWTIAPSPRQTAADRVVHDSGSDEVQVDPLPRRSQNRAKRACVPAKGSKAHGKDAPNGELRAQLDAANLRVASLTAERDAANKVGQAQAKAAETLLKSERDGHERLLAAAKSATVAEEARHALTKKLKNVPLDPAPDATAETPADGGPAGLKLVAFANKALGHATRLVCPCTGSLPPPRPRYPIPAARLSPLPSPDHRTSRWKSMTTPCSAWCASLWPTKSALKIGAPRRFPRSVPPAPRSSSTGSMPPSWKRRWRRPLEGGPP